jgi:hypothetical protein
VSVPGRGSDWTWIKGQCHENAMKNGIRKDDCSNKHGLEKREKIRNPNIKYNALNGV